MATYILVVYYLTEDSTTALCTTGIMDRKTFIYDYGLGPFALSPKLHCRLHVYSKADVACCLDEIKQNEEKNGRKQSRFVFIGDSRIRQQFYLFSEVLNVCAILCPTYTMCVKYYSLSHFSSFHSASTKNNLLIATLISLPILRWLTRALRITGVQG